MLAFLFGPFYYVVKGMWRKGLTLFVLCVIGGFILDALMELVGLGSFTRATGFAAAAVYATLSPTEITTPRWCWSRTAGGGRSRERTHRSSARLTMTNEEFEALVSRLEAEAKRNPAGYRTRVLLMALLGNAYLAVMLACIVAMFFAAAVSAYG